MTIKTICDAIKQSFKNSLQPANIIPSILLICSLAKRSGLSCMMSTATVITNQSKFGAPSGPLPDGSSNMMNGLINIIISEVFRALREDAAISVAIPPGAITVQTTGANSAGSVVSVGSNILPASGVAVIQ